MWIGQEQEGESRAWANEDEILSRPQVGIHPREEANVPNEKSRWVEVEKLQAHLDGLHPFEVDTETIVQYFQWVKDAEQGLEWKDKVCQVCLKGIEEIFNETR